jgi:hypothetical protein
MKVSVDVDPDEHRLLQLVWGIKKSSGWGKFGGSINNREIIMLNEQKDYKLKI